ncbi:MAG: tetratricopeptide repeat protein [Planctomycetes bacterium]|nr:tetratricopeptide repeat protein [Planctomycetota bacterium]
MSAYLLVTLVAALGPTSHFERGLAAYDAGQFDRARSAFTAALADAGVAQGPILYNIGNCAYRQGRHAEAVLFYRRALLRMPRDEEVTFNLRRVEAHLGIDGASDRSFEAIVLGVVDTMTPAEGLLLVGVLQVAGFLALVVWRRRRGVRLAMGAAVVVALLGGARLVYRQWYAPPSGVVLSEEIALRAQPHASLPATLELRAGEVVTVEESSDRWMWVVHARGCCLTRRVGVGVVD